jgi:hypothetical protein
MGFLSTAVDSIERSVDRLSQRAFEGPRRDRSPEEPTRRQLTAKAIVDGQATEDQVKEALDFSLAEPDERGGMKLTPLGELVLSGYPDDRPARKAAA